MEDYYVEDLQNPATLAPRIVNLNAIIPRMDRKRSKIKMAPESSLQSSVKLDYSDTYRENNVLEEDLEEQLNFLTRSEQRTLAEEGKQLEEIRKQVDEITKLQEAVNARQPDDTAAIVADGGRVGRYGRPRSGGTDKGGFDFRELSKVSRSQLRIAAEREKFSSKNLFNVRRAKTSLGFEPMHTRKFFKSPIVPSDDLVDNEQPTEKPKSANPARRSKGYLQQTMASQGGVRPKTAAAAYQREQKKDDILPPRAQSAAFRSRSRRELELLSRVMPVESEPVLSFDPEQEWKKFCERRRFKRLQEIKAQSQDLQTKVDYFLSDLDRFNRKGHGKVTAEVKSRPEDL